MAKPIFHALNSAKRFGGIPADYQAIHCKMDSSKRAFPKMTHRLVFHSEYGHRLIEDLIGPSIVNSDGDIVQVKDICHQHTFEDLGFIPTLADYSKELTRDLVKRQVSLVHHCRLSAKRFGGEPGLYQNIHAKMLEPADTLAGRAILNSSFGIYIIEELFGITLKGSERVISTRDIAEQHVLRSCNQIPTLSDWFEGVDCLWMVGLKKARLVLVD